MKTFIRWAAYFMAAAVVAFAPVGASAQPAKIFTLSMGNASLSGVVVATITNATPQGNSTINSTILGIQSGAGWQIASANSSNGQASVLPDGTISVVNMSPVKPGKSFTVTIQLKGGTMACNTATTWFAVPNTGNNNNGNVFAPSPSQDPNALVSTATCDGTLACGAGFGVAGGHVTNASRLPNNKDGSPCALVNYDFTDSVTGANNTLLQWDTTSQPAAGFQYTVTWQPVLFGSLNPPPVGQTKVAWYVNGVLITPVPARACLSTTPPTPYGTLQGPVDNVTTTIFVSASAPAVGTPITIDRERMVIDTGSSGNTWKVKRGQGGTTAAAHSQYYADNSTLKNVMSNPLPLDDSLNQMQMCLIDEFWTAVDPALCGGVNSGTACVQKTSTALDLGDGFMKGN